MRAAAFFLLMAASVAAQSPESLFRERKFDEARTAAKAQIAANKNDANAMYWLGRVAEAEDKGKEALDWFEKAVKIDDKNALYHFWIGNVVGEEAQNASPLRQPFLAKRVKNEFEKAVALDPTLVEARQGLANFYQMAPGIMGGSNEKAAEQVRAIQKLNPYRGHFAAAQYAQRDKNPEGELREWQAGIAAFPDSASFYYNIAGAQRRQSKWDEAFATYETMFKKFPNETVPHLGWGAVSALSGKQLEKGEAELKWFIANAKIETVGNQNMAGAHFRLGMIYEKTARKELARAEYNETQKLNPQHPDVKKALAGLK
jgi:tetratricopeptide (TPR) repeat protein